MTWTVQTSPGRDIPRWRHRSTRRGEIQLRPHPRTTQTTAGIRYFEPDIQIGRCRRRNTVKFTLKITRRVFRVRNSRGLGREPDQPERRASRGADYGKNPVGTGPFTFKSFQADAQIEYAANANYWGGAPQIDGIKVRIIPEPSTRNIELEAGTLDIGMRYAGTGHGRA